MEFKDIIDIKNKGIIIKDEFIIVITITEYILFCRINDSTEYEELKRFDININHYRSETIFLKGLTIIDDINEGKINI